MAFRVYNKTTNMMSDAANVVFDDRSGRCLEEVSQDENLIVDQNDKKILKFIKILQLMM